ncbi:peptidoglycan-binding protein [Patescibacteria group bacterium]|nr:peptidoglycan-binding protein [Patescibacteria group bacterium]MBU1683725.1 peptidoglycan-binding protein [Patescibacteria group bacterium]MBU1935526.1 peptidoglycan-binding protein [Patescibacteria group bacterium]
MNTAQKKIIGIFVLLLYILALAPVSFASNVSATSGQKRKFLVTGYYSPLPNQSFYVRGSYEADVRLNGRGTNGADGTQVYTGMLAAPRTYPFGTRISLPGLGVGEVHDRGGAILAGADYDRIDVWMGHGEEGLARALNWGARVVEGEIYWTAHQIEPGLSFSWIDSGLPASMVDRMRANTLQNPAVFNKPVTTTNTTDVKELQEALTTLGFYSGPVTGTYGPLTTQAVLEFQLAENVIPNENAGGAGNFGPKTSARLQEMLEGYNNEVLKERDRLEGNRLLLAVGLGKNSEGEDVVALQRMLWELGYYDGELNGEYDSATIDAVFEFQKTHGILNSEWDSGAGYFGKQTYAALTEVVNEKIERIASYPMQLQVWVPAKRELPKIANLTPPQEMMERQELHFSPDLVIKKEIPESTQLVYEIDLNDRNDQVKLLQDILIEHGYLAAGLNTGYYGGVTQQAVLKFQMEKGIVDCPDGAGAGRVGPKTRAALNLL